MQVAEAKGLPKLKYHLLPRTKGFAVTVQCLRNVGKESHKEHAKWLFHVPALTLLCSSFPHSACFIRRMLESFLSFLPLVCEN